MDVEDLHAFEVRHAEAGAILEDMERPLSGMAPLVRSSQCHSSVTWLKEICSSPCAPGLFMHLSDMATFGFPRHTSYLEELKETRKEISRGSERDLEVLLVHDSQVTNFGGALGSTGAISVSARTANLHYWAGSLTKPLLQQVGQSKRSWCGNLLHWYWPRYETSDSSQAPKSKAWQQKKTKKTTTQTIQHQ
jgi:hypothetical protein